jgi:hypothetical protein
MTTMLAIDEIKLSNAKGKNIYRFNVYMVSVLYKTGPNHVER